MGEFGTVGYCVLAIYMAAMAGVVLWTFRGQVGEIWRLAAAGGHTKMVSAPVEFWKPDFWLEITLWGVVVTAMFGRLSSYGSDQVLVQRYLAAGSARKMARSLIFCGLLSLPVGGTLYLLGLGFFAYYHRPENTALLASLGELVARTGDHNMVLPHFVRNVLPSGVSGLVFAGLFAATMSVFSSGLNSLSTVTCVDFIKRLRRKEAAELRLSHARWITLAWGVAVTAASLCVFYAHSGMLMKTMESIIGFFSGPILGMFLLSIFTKRGAIRGARFSAHWSDSPRRCSCGNTSRSFGTPPPAACRPWFSANIISLAAPSRPHDEVYPLTIWGRHTAVNEE